MSSASLINNPWQLPDSLLCQPNNPGVHEYGLEDFISIYPNPTNGLFQIQSEKLNIKTIEVINVLGEKVYRLDANKIFNHSGTIDLSSSPDGIYFVRVQTDKCMVSKKVVVMR